MHMWIFLFFYTTGARPVGHARRWEMVNFPTKVHVARWTWQRFSCICKIANKVTQWRMVKHLFHQNWWPCFHMFPSISKLTSGAIGCSQSDRSCAHTYRARSQKTIPSQFGYESSRITRFIHIYIYWYKYIYIKTKRHRNAFMYSIHTRIWYARNKASCILTNVLIWSNMY